MNKLVLIITDANSKIGNGHANRCLRIANALEKLGTKVKFIGFSISFLKLIQANNFEVRIVSENLLVQNIQTITEKENLEIGAILVDSYAISELGLLGLQKSGPIIAFDYDFKYRQGINGIINYHPWAWERYSPKNYITEPEIKMLGLSFIPLGAEFKTSNFVFNEEVSNILFTTGSTDPLGLTQLFLEEWRRLIGSKNIKLNVVIGPHFEDNTFDNRDLIRFHYNQKNLVYLMQNNDILISAGGVTLYEGIALGIPTIGYAFSDNQLNQKMLDGLVSWAGDVRTPTESTNKVNMSSVIEKTIRLIDNKEQRFKYHQQVNNVIDGFGAERIAETIIKNWLT